MRFFRITSLTAIGILFAISWGLRASMHSELESFVKSANVFGADPRILDPLRIYLSQVSVSVSNALFLLGVVVLLPLNVLAAALTKRN